MASAVLEAFVKLFADDSELKKSFGALPGFAREQGNRTGAAFSNAIGASLTPQRPSQAVPLQLPRVGGQEVDISSPFKQGFQQFKTARELADIQKGGGEAFTQTGTGARKAAEDVDDYELSVRDAAGTVRLLGTSVLSELNPAVGALGSVALDAARNLKGLGVGIAAGGAAAAAAALLLGLYIAKVKEGITAQVDLANAVRRADFGAVQSQIQKTSDAIGTYVEQAKIAAQETDSRLNFGPLGVAAIALAGDFGELKTASEVIVAYWSNVFGPSADELRERMIKQVAAAKTLFLTLEVPKKNLQAIVESQQLIQQGIALEREAATSANAVRAATDALVASKNKQVEAQARLIEEERKDIIRRRSLGELDPEVARVQIEDVNRRAKLVRDKGLLDEEATRRASDRAAAEFDAKQREREGKDLAFRRRHTDAAIGLAKAVLDSEFSGNRSLEQVFQARAQLFRASTQSQLAALKEQSDAQRAALQERIQGATDSERADLERELTQVTQEEAAKRTEILSNAVQQAIQLAQKERQERLAQAEQVFSIQRSLGQRRIQDDIATQAAIAQSAQKGSQVQIAALQKVADMQAQLQQQGRAAITQGIGLLQQQAQRAGLEGPAFVSLTSIQEGVERQRQRDELTRRQLQAGESVRTEDAQALASNPLEIFKQFGNDIGAASQAAFTPIADQFKTIVGDGISTELGNLTTKVTEQFVGLTTAINPALGSMEKLFAETWDRMIAKAEDGTSLLGQSLTRMVEDNITRSFADANKRI